MDDVILNDNAIVIADDNNIDYNVMDTDVYIYKSPNLIESDYNLSINEQRLVYLASKKLKPIFIKSNLRPSQLNTLAANIKFKDLKIYVSEFKQTFGIKYSMYSQMEKLTKSLYNSSIQYLKDNGEKVEKRWVITCKYNPKERYVALTFHPDLIMDLLIFKGRYGKLKFNALTLFQSSNTFRLYELLSNSLYKGTRVFELAELKRKLEIGQDEYPKFYELKRRVIQPAVNLINKDTDLHVTYEAIRAGRFTKYVKFTIEKNTSASVEVIDNEEINDDIPDEQVEAINKILGMTLDKTEVSRVSNAAFVGLKKNNVDKTFIEYVTEKMNFIKEYNKNHDINDFISLLCSFLSKDYKYQPIKYMKTNEDGTKKLKFANYQQREYDYVQLEEQLTAGNYVQDEVAATEENIIDVSVNNEIELEKKMKIEEVKTELQQEIPETKYKTWIYPLFENAWIDDENILCLACKDDFNKKVINTMFKDIINKAIKEQSLNSFKIVMNQNL